MLCRRPTSIMVQDQTCTCGSENRGCRQYGRPAAHSAPRYGHATFPPLILSGCGVDSASHAAVTESVSATVRVRVHAPTPAKADSYADANTHRRHYRRDPNTIAFIQRDLRELTDAASYLCPEVDRESSVAKNRCHIDQVSHNRGGAARYMRAASHRRGGCRIYRRN